jgi:hypothetical protein
MGLFDKIKDNAKNISIKAIESTREYDNDLVADDQKNAGEVSNVAAVIEPTAPADIVKEVAEELVQEDRAVAASNGDKRDNKDQKKDSETPAESKDPTRKSKVIEVSKTEYEQAKKEKQKSDEDETAKKAAKERLAKDFTPSYKSEKPEPKPDVIKKPVQRITVGINDVTPSRYVDPIKEAIYARERAALTALASRRKLDGSVPVYVTSHMNFKTRVFVDRLEYSGSFGKTVLPVEQIAWVKLRSGGTGIIVETHEGKRIVMVVKPTDRLSFADAVLKVQSMQPKKGKFKDTKTVRIDELEKFSEGVDEIEKLAKLYERGIITQDEFDKKKKQILGI